MTKNVEDCTHLVVLNLWRTMKLLEGIALGKNIVSPDWITDGYRNGLIPGCFHDVNADFFTMGISH